MALGAGWCRLLLWPCGGVGLDGEDQQEERKACTHAGWFGPAASPIDVVFALSTDMSGAQVGDHHHDQQDHERQDERHHLRRSGAPENLGRGFKVNKYFDCFLDIVRDKLV